MTNGHQFIEAGEAGLLLKKLLDEKLPVRAFMMAERHTWCTLKGYVDSFTSKGLVVAEVPRNPSGGNNLCFNMGDPCGSECSYQFADERVVPEGLREFAAQQYGNTMLLISNNHKNHWIVLAFNS
jgi:hypothetical protein